MIREIKALDARQKWALRVVCRYALAIMALILYTLVVTRAADARAERKFEAWKLEYQAEQTQRAASLIQSGMPNLYEIRLDAEAQELARVLYGIKGNSEKDMKTYCWCVFNRVDSPDYPETIQEVIAQPQQWMRYSPDNPVLDDLYQLAKGQLDAWHNGATRPVSSDFVFMSWSPSDLCLRDRWEEGSRTMYWRYGQ